MNARYTGLVPNKDGTLKAREFVFFCEDDILTRWPSGMPKPVHRVMWTTLQFHWGTPKVHFELQPMMARRLVEVGLHFEGAEAANEAWAAALGNAADDLIPQLGFHWELEDWTKSWRRLHRPYRFENLTTDFAREVAGELRRGIEVLYPFVSGRTDIPEIEPETKEAPQSRSPRSWRRSRARR